MTRSLVTILAMAALLSTAAAAETMLERLLRVSGLTAAPGQMRGPGDDISAGDIWVASPGGAAPVVLTSGGGYTSPIFSPTDGSILALKSAGVVRIPVAGGRVVTIQKAAGVLKLIGFDARNTDEVVVLLESSGSTPLGVLSLKTGKVTPLPYDAKSDSERRMLAQVRGQDRVYGDARVYVKTESKAGMSRTIEWTDVYLRRGDAAPQNVSACDGVNCGQPALSPDGRRVAFVKSDG
jgi:hypothetical protein